MKKWVLPITCTCIVFGLLLTLSLRLQNSVMQNNGDDKNDVLISLVKNNEAEISAYENTLSELRQQYDKMTAKPTNEADIKALQRELAALKAQAGLTAIEGPGIIITLDDNKVGLTQAPQSDANNYIIHYQYILRIVNDLKRGGAEAISVNDQRLATASEIRCVGNTILINTTRLAPPYEIKAIGDVLSLEDTLLNSSQYNNLRYLNFPVSYKTTNPQEPALAIPAYSGSYSTKYLTPSEEPAAPEQEPTTNEEE